MWDLQDEWSVALLDTQQVEIVGRHRLIEHLLDSNIEVAMPLRDKGVDLVLYWTQEVLGFQSQPIQLKAAMQRSFSIDAKYAAHAGLVIVFAWHVNEPERSGFFALTYPESIAVAADMGYTDTKSWRGGRRYSTSKPGVELTARLQPFNVDTGGWMQAAKWWRFDPLQACDRAADGDQESVGLLREWIPRAGVGPSDSPSAPALASAQELIRNPAQIHVTDRETIRAAISLQIKPDNWQETLRSGFLKSAIKRLMSPNQP